MLNTVLYATFWLVMMVSIFVPLEHLFSLHPAKLWRRQTGTDLGWYFMNSLIPGAVLALPMLLMARAANHIDPYGICSEVGSWPLWVKVPLTLIVSDFGAYWAHRAFHTYPWLWQFHAIHHSPEEMDWLVNSRAHPFEIVFTRLCGLAPVYLIGLGRISHHADPVVAIVFVVGLAWTYFIHSNVRFRFGPLEWLITTPAFHHWHHTADEKRNHNFAALFPFIDRCFGTAWLPRHWPPAYGISGKIPETLHEQFFYPLQRRPKKAGPADPKTGS